MLLSDVAIFTCVQSRPYFHCVFSDMTGTFPNQYWMRSKAAEPNLLACVSCTYILRVSGGGGGLSKPYLKVVCYCRYHCKGSREKTVCFDYSYHLTHETRFCTRFHCPVTASLYFLTAELTFVTAAWLTQPDREWCYWLFPGALNDWRHLVIRIRILTRKVCIDDWIRLPSPSQQRWGESIRIQLW